MVAIPEAARKVIESGRLAHLVTINKDGSPQVTIVWVGTDGDELVTAHFGNYQKLRNVRRDDRVVLSIETDESNAQGLTQYLVVHGRARIAEGGAAELLQKLAHTYIGPDVKFPPGDNHPPGYVMHITPERFTGVGPWAV
jgi:PPOX class probable F420-dependent enzyme